MYHRIAACLNDPFQPYRETFSLNLMICAAPTDASIVGTRLAAWHAITGRSSVSVNVEGKMDGTLKTIDFMTLAAMMATVVGIVLCLIFLFAPATFGVA